ncbi:MAG: FAD binding domain-containing protein, partial [Thermoleophilia bacterium]|nr:FAD binding domain-containing protein [Thermoleophilia bacterium]
RIGALVRHKTCERAQELRGRFGALADAAPLISDPIVRNLGTVAGSLAHADPQGDWGSVMLAFRARVEARSAAGTREIPIAEFFAGPFTSTLEANEIVTAVLVPDPGPRAGGTYLKLERKVGDFATVGAAVHVELDDGRVRRAGIGLTGVGPRNLSAPAAEEALADAVPDDDAVRGAAELAAEAAEPRDDVRGSAEFKRNVVRVYVERGLRTAVAAAQAREGDA